MNKEIKEILDKIQNVVEHKEASYNGLVETKAEDYKLLLDYITNLQQENEILHENNQDMQEEMARVWEEDERLKEWKEDLLKENIEFENIRKEAIEFIKEKISSTKGVINDYMYHKEHNKHLIELLNEDIEMYKSELNILQNGSDEE